MEYNVMSKIMQQSCLSSKVEAGSGAHPAIHRHLEPRLK